MGGTWGDGLIWGSGVGNCILELGFLLFLLFFVGVNYLKN